MKFLVICQYGHSRSVALKRSIDGIKPEGTHAAVAIGWATSGDAIEVLAAWADRILVMCGHAYEHIPEEHKSKIIDCQLGHDQWSNPYNQDLRLKCNQLLKDKLGLETQLQ